MRMNQGVLKREMDVNKAVLSQPELSQPKGEGKKKLFSHPPCKPQLASSEGSHLAAFSTHFPINLH